MQKPRGRYVKLNPVDYLLIVLFCLLALSLLFRGVFLFRDKRADRSCVASVEFVMREVDAATCDLLQAGALPFRLPNGTLLEGAQIDRVVATVKYLPDENGELQPVVSETAFDVYVSFAAEGSRTEDNAFLLNGIHRLATGDTATLVRGNREFKVDFTKVEFKKA
jgi:hypothetical protein